MDESLQIKTARWVEVLVDAPGAVGLYTYEVTGDFSVKPGDIVSVFFGHQQVSAIAIRLASATPEGLNPSSIKPIENIINSTFFTKEYWQLLNRVARYYQTPFIRVLRTALPPGLLSKSQRRIRLNKAISFTLIEAQIKSFSVSSLAMSQLAHSLVSLLREAPQGDYSWQYLKQQLGSAAKRAASSAPKSGVSAASLLAQALRQLIKLNLVESYLAPPRGPRVQKRQAVLLLQSANTIASFSVPVSSTAATSISDRTRPAAAASLARGLSDRQKDIVLGLERAGGELWLSDALQLLHTTRKTLTKIAEQGYLVVEPREVLRSGNHSTALPDQPKVLTADQAKALATLKAITGYGEALLHGVTGSGKTEVYLQAIAPILKAQKSALVLVPEIGLTPQLTDRFRSRFGDQVCVYHSGLSEGERYDTWRQMLTGTAQIIIGTRSAVFAPLPNLGIIILDEEHDSSFKQDQPMPCYHARQVARWRAELENCPLILGSATPSIETWVRFKNTAPTLHYLPLPQRVHARPHPPIEVIDMRDELHRGNRTIFSRPLQLAIEELIEKGNQGILFIHRRGHSSFVSCRSCGFVMECPHCDVSLSFHQTHREAKAQLRCHYCGYSKPHPPKCPECASPYLKNFGSGTQRVVNDLAKYLPEARCIRFDSDTTRNKGAHRALLTRFAQGEADLLVGTQMLTKGIDLPQVTLVGVIAADGLLFMPDFRASERAFQTITQVAGRAGRGETPGKVIVQTYSPNHVAIEALPSDGEVTKKRTALSNSAQVQSDSAVSLADAQVGYGAFLEAELSDRADLAYPPYGRLVLLRISGIDERTTEKAAEKTAQQAEALFAQACNTNEDKADENKADENKTSDQRLNLAHTTDDQLVPDDLAPYELLGPVPAPIYRVARRYRWQILIKLRLDTPLPQLTHWPRQMSKGVSLTIDVDPLNLS
ncbi:MAG: primosomal protein N' [Cyanobacteria bacterium J06598_3]